MPTIITLPQQPAVMFPAFAPASKQHAASRQMEVAPRTVSETSGATDMHEPGLYFSTSL